MTKYYNSKPDRTEKKISRNSHQRRKDFRPKALLAKLDTIIIDIVDIGYIVKYYQSSLVLVVSAAQPGRGRGTLALIYPNHSLPLDVYGSKLFSELKAKKKCLPKGLDGTPVFVCVWGGG